MSFVELLLVAAGLAIASGGVYMLIRSANADRRVEAAGRTVHPRPYIPLGVVAVGLIIAYHSFSDYATLDSSDITIMFLFVLALAILLGLRFLIADKINLPPEEIKPTDDPKPKT